MDIQAILAALALINQTLPAATGLILSFRNEEGIETPLNVLALKSADVVDEVTAKNVAELEAFLNRHKQ